MVATIEAVEIFEEFNPVSHSVPMYEKGRERKIAWIVELLSLLLKQLITSQPGNCKGISSRNKLCCRSLN